MAIFTGSDFFQHYENNGSLPCHEIVVTNMIGLNLDGGNEGGGKFKHPKPRPDDDSCHLVFNSLVLTSDIPLFPCSYL